MLCDQHFWRQNWYCEVLKYCCPWRGQKCLPLVFLHHDCSSCNTLCKRTFVPIMFSRNCSLWEKELRDDVDDDNLFSVLEKALRGKKIIALLFNHTDTTNHDDFLLMTYDVDLRRWLRSSSSIFFPVFNNNISIFHSRTLKKKNTWTGKLLEKTQANNNHFFFPNTT